MEQPPPPPPPHGSPPPPRTGPRAGGLPDGKYDIFVIPPSSAGSGFLYLPSLQVQRNSFLAGVACTATAFMIYHHVVPVVKEWVNTTINGGGSGVVMLMLGVGVISWAFGKTQGEGINPGSKSAGGSAGPGHTHSAGTGYTGPPPQQHQQQQQQQQHNQHQQQQDQNQHQHQQHHNHQQPPPPPPPQPPPPQSPPPPNDPPPKPTWQRTQAGAKATADAKSSWEKAREETRKREEQKRREEEIKRRREELEKERLRQREKETRERLERELKEKRERELKDIMEKRAREEKERKEREEREKREKEQKERLEQLEKERLERLAQLEREKAAAEAATVSAAAAAAAAAAKVNAKRPPIPTAKTERDDDAYSFRPYDRPRKSNKAGSAESIYSEESYAASATTAKTTPPGSERGPYTTKDPDKIVIKAVYSFNNAFLRTPIAQLISGQGHVTDGLILRITTEGLFIDDDVRGVPQREWDVKAWTLKLAEVWCPGIPYTALVMSDAPSFSGAAKSDAQLTALQRLFSRQRSKRCHERGEHKLPSITKQHITPVPNPFIGNLNTDKQNQQSCETTGMHVLRASIRDQEGKKYVFILSQSEGWKVAVGLQRLRRGTQVRALGVTGLPQNEAKLLLDNLGWSS